MYFCIQVRVRGYFSHHILIRAPKYVVRILWVRLILPFCFSTKDCRSAVFSSHHNVMGPFSRPKLTPLIHYFVENVQCFKVIDWSLLCSRYNSVHPDRDEVYGVLRKIRKRSPPVLRFQSCANLMLRPVRLGLTEKRPFERFFFNEV